MHFNSLHLFRQPQRPTSLCFWHWMAYRLLPLCGVCALARPRGRGVHWQRRAGMSCVFCMLFRNVTLHLWSHIHICPFFQISTRVKIHNRWYLLSSPLLAVLRSSRPSLLCQMWGTGMSIDCHFLHSSFTIHRMLTLVPFSWFVVKRLTLWVLFGILPV